MIRSNARAAIPIAAVGLLFAFSAHAAWADPVKVGRLSFQTHTVITVNTVPTVSLVSSPNLTADQRAAIVESRLAGFVKRPGVPRFVVTKVNGEYAVVVNGGVIAVPYPADAARAGLSRRQVAHTWAARLKSAWATPYLRLSPQGVVVGVGATRPLQVAGAARGPISISVDSPGVASAKEVGPGVVALTGLAPGRGSVSVTRGGATATTAFLVMKPAGSVQPVRLEVTGSSIPGDLLEDFTDTELRRAIRLEPGAWFTAQQRPRFPKEWSKGSSLKYSIPVRLAGPGYLAIQTKVPIEITRLPLRAEDNVTLYYSNNPETIRGPEALFHHSLPKNGAARFLYHHQNKGARPLNMVVELVNHGAGEATVQIVDGSATPSMDTVLVGHQAAFRYLKRVKAGTGIVVRLAPGEHRRVFARRLNPGITMSGVMLFRPLQAADLSLSMHSEDHSAATPATAPRAPSETIYPDPDKTLDFTYTVGGPWTYVPIGRYPVENDRGATLQGNYGVLYTVRLHLSNPTPREATTRVLFEPRAGRAQAVFVIDGTLTETTSLYPPSEERVMTVKLRPNEKRTVTLVTMPSAGGSYPAALIVRN